ncbi:hypothetical protein [Solibacillus daqui]|uniref:hypothetical protein n=1 Tax=Solibacillus daqui TaxID=2912187 RepID=UPI0023663E75|nr:hypothetical protein [Solibacillus daqui]
MTDFDLISVVGLGLISGYLTVYVVDEVTPKLNDDGELENTLPGDLLMMGVYVIKRCINIIMEGMYSNLEVCARY